MATLSSIQRQALKLQDVATETIPGLHDFYHGRIPELSHYKRLTVRDREEAVSIATYGYFMALKELGVKLFFTQSLIVGASVLGTHHKIYTVLPSQYGKSFLSACIGLLLASAGQPISVSANDAGLTKKIMDEVWRILPNCPKSFKDKLTESADKIEKGQTSLSKNRVGFVGGGFIEGITLGGKFSDSLSGNKAVGQSGNFLIDESALIPDANYAETGRSEVAYRKDGKPYVSIEMSNPHQINHFYRDMIQDPLETGVLIVWADVRISIEEGKQIFYNQDVEKPKFEETKFFKNEAVCRSYYLCDFGNSSDSSFFSTSPIVDNSPFDYTVGINVMGLDSANRGADAIMGGLLRFPDEHSDKLRMVALTNFKPALWKDFETPQEIEDLVIQYVKHYNVKAIVMDLGGGEYLYERIGQRILDEHLDVALKGVYFNNSTTKQRVRQNFDFSDGSANGAELGVNKRAEMYLDLRDLIGTGSITFTEQVNDKLKDEMSATGNAIYTTGNKIQLEDKTKVVKKSLGHSPDSLDATVLAVHAYLLYVLGLIGDVGISFYE